MICYLCFLLSTSILWEVQPETALRKLYPELNELLLQLANGN